MQCEKENDEATEVSDCYYASERRKILRRERWVKLKEGGRWV